MGNFSREPQQVLMSNLSQGYVGLHIEQGVPVLDRDLNLLSDFISHMVRSVVQRYIGSGVLVSSEAFTIQPIDQTDFRIIGPGICLVNGLEVSLPATINYTDQDGVPPLNPPAAARTDTVYLDVWLEEVDGTADSDLLNGSDVGMQTAVRQALRWQVLAAEGAAEPPAPPTDHHHYPLAQLQHDPASAQIGVSDLRRQLSPITDLEQRLSHLETMVLRPAFAAPGNQISPNFGVTGQAVQLFGRNFDGGNLQVLFGTVPAVVQSASAIEIVATVPGRLVEDAPINITVRTDGGEVTSDDTFTRIANGTSAPIFANNNQISPNVGNLGTPVQLRGSNFQDVHTVIFGTFPAADIIDSSNTHVNVLPPAELPLVLPVQVTVISSSGSDTSSETFRLISF